MLPGPMRSFDWCCWTNEELWLMVHQWDSSEQVPVPCDVCGKRCWSFDYLSLHVSLRHVGSDNSGASSMWRVWKEMLKFRLLKPSRFSATCGIISTIQVLWRDLNYPRLPNLASLKSSTSFFPVDSTSFSKVYYTIDHQGKEVLPYLTWIYEATSTFTTALNPPEESLYQLSSVSSEPQGSVVVNDDQSLKGEPCYLEHRAADCLCEASTSLRENYCIQSFLLGTLNILFNHEFWVDLEEILENAVVVVNGGIEKMCQFLEVVFNTAQG